LTPRSLHSFPTRRSSDLTHAVDLEIILVVAGGRKRGIAQWNLDPVAFFARVFELDNPVRFARRRADHAQVAPGFDHRIGDVNGTDRKSTRLNSSHVSISY